MQKRIIIAGAVSLVVFLAVNQFEQAEAMRAGPWHIVCGIGSQKVCDFWTDEPSYTETEWFTNFVYGKGFVVTSRQVQKMRGE